MVYLVKNKILGKADCCLKQIIAIAFSSLGNSDIVKGVRQGKQATWTASLLCCLLPDPFCDLIWVSEEEVCSCISVWDLNYEQTFEHISLECTIGCSDRWRVAGGMFQWI